jgi:urea transporter/murein DD-endopeptidase MepM/ murein hydrolase activator NlpD
MLKKADLDEVVDGVLNSYGQILFVDKPRYSRWLLLVTMFFPFSGISGLYAVLVSHACARLLGFDRQLIRSGFLGYNSLMTGIVLGGYFNLNTALVVILTLAAVLTLFLTLWFRKVLYDKNLPFLSLPFLAAVWTMLLSVRGYKSLALSDAGIYTYNELAYWGGLGLVRWYEWLQQLHIPGFWDVFFRSMGAIFFQYNLLAGLIITLVLFWHSRIATVYAFLGFLTGYYFFRFVDGNFNELHYSYIGFNFILTSIALGSFFLVPGFSALMVSFLAVPLTAMLISAFTGLFYSAQLPLYSLPFNLVVIMMIVVLRQRWQANGPQLVVEQQGQPEKNLYSFQSRAVRFKHLYWLPIQLPFFGQWRVSQGHSGAITHQGAFAWAWDFDVVDSHNKTYKGEGLECGAYYCYDKPVLAPAAGWVVQLIDEIPDNEIGQSNLEHNWGNTLVIKHLEGLYSKLSHLKAGSFLVKSGDFVQAGEVVARCGSSGRSPEPHLHFQMQATAFIDAPTLWYPLAQFLKIADNKSELLHFAIPQEQEVVTRIEAVSMARDAFGWQPGQSINVEAENKLGELQKLVWTAGIDMTNTRYLFCEHSQSTLWYIATDSSMMCTTFRGDTTSALHAFFIACQHLLLADLPEQWKYDEPELPQLHPGPWLWLQDVLAPFFRFLHTGYKSNSRVTAFGIMGPQAMEMRFEAWIQPGIKKPDVEQRNGVDGDKVLRLSQISGKIAIEAEGKQRPLLREIKFDKHPIWRVLHFV